MIFACVFSNNALSTVRSVIHFVQQVARYHDQTMHGTLFNPFGYSQFRATSCTLRSTINPRTVHYLPSFGHSQFRASRCTLRSTTEPHRERYLTLFRHFRFRATSCTLRSTISCNKLHATKIKKCGEKQRIFSPHFNWIQRQAELIKSRLIYHKHDGLFLRLFPR